MKPHRLSVLLALFYPFATATVSAGLLAFVMIMLKVDLLLVATVVLWFYFASASAIYIVAKDALKTLGFHGFFLGFMVTFLILAVLSLTLLACTPRSTFSVP